MDRPPPRPEAGALRAARNNPDNGSLLDAIVSGEHFVASVRAGCKSFVSQMPTRGHQPVAARPKMGTAAPMGPRALAKDLSNPVAVDTRLDAGFGRGAHLSFPVSQLKPSTADVPLHTFLTEAIPQGDPRLETARFQAAARKEVDRLLARGTFTVVKESELPAGANVIGGRFVYTLKNAGTRAEEVKGRYVAQGYRDQAKLFVIHNLATLRQRSTRILASTSAVMGLRIFSHDITKAYLQSQERFTMQLYLRPRPGDRHQFNLKEGELLRIDLPLYGICDAGDYGHVTFATHTEQDLGMVSLTPDPALYIKRHPDGELSGLLGAYVDDVFMGGDERFQLLTKRMLLKFQGKERKLDDAEFVRVHLSTLPGQERFFTLGLAAYADNLDPLPTNAIFKKFTSVRASLAWLVHTRPDLCCGINEAAQVTEGAYGPDSVRALNALIKRAKGGRDLVLSYPPLDGVTLHLRVYSDSSFANNADQSSQLGYIVLLCDDSGRAHVLSFTSRKSLRVVRSVLAGEVYAFAEAFDEAFIIRYDLERIYGKHIPLSLYTDSKQLFEVVTKASHPTEKRLMVDIAAAREAYNRHDISNVGLIATNDNISDACTKRKPCPAMDTLLRTGLYRTPVIQWDIRPPTSPPSSTTEGPTV